jgi:hypothetical protein
MNYWLDLFTGTTWAEFQKAGSKVSGFNLRMRKMAAQIEPGDILLCYLTGVMRWVGALRVIGPSSDKSKIWKDAEFPVRLKVEPIVSLQPEHGVPLSDLEGQLAFYESNLDAGKFKGFLRQSPRRFSHSQDGDLILSLLQEASKHPVSRPVDPRKLARRPVFFKAEEQKGKKIIETVVSVPDSEGDEEPVPAEQTLDKASSRHSEIQFHLLSLGSQMGFDVWVARNDRSRSWKGHILGTMPRMVDKLPTQFNEATNRTIEMIDVLWLQGNSIIAAFEVESTTSIYSGLLRMSDLLALQPNLEINLFLVAPEERRDKVEQEILRPTFQIRKKPLSKICGFISFSELVEKLEGIRKLGLTDSLKPEFIHKIAEYFVENDIC